MSGMHAHLTTSGFCKFCGDPIRGPVCKCGAQTAESAAKRTGDTFAADGEDVVHTKYTDAYISTGLEEDLDVGLRRMANVHPEWVDKDCVNCGKKCTEGAIAAPYGPKTGKPFCHDCYNKVFAKGQCAACNQPILGQNYTQQEGKLYHAECYTNERRCYNCRKPIFGDAISALGKDYHEDCFECGKCQKKISGGSFLDYNGVPYCKECGTASQKSRSKQTLGAEEAAARRALNESVAERQEQLKDLKQMKHVGVGDICDACGKELLANAINLDETRAIHLECFRCFVCHKDFPDMRYLEKDKKFYHADCHKTATSSKCTGCGKAISVGKFVSYEGGKYHVECFACAGCNTSLNGIPFGEKDGKNYCENCLSSKASAPRTLHTDERQQGFTVNPVTGKKEMRDFEGAKVGTRQPGLGGAPKCTGCNGPVYSHEKADGPNLTVWHKRCLVCKRCSKMLDRMAVTKGGSVYCSECFRHL